MDSRIRALVERAQGGRSWLRERGLVTLAAALLLEVSTAAPGGRPRTRGVLRALSLLLLLFVALVAAAIDGAVSLVVAKSLEVGRAALERAPWHVPPLPPIGASELLDRQGRPLRGSARKARIAALERERARIAYQRSLRGRTRLAYERIRIRARAASAALRAIETRFIAARGEIVADIRHTGAWLSPRAARVRAEVVRRIAPLSERSRAVVATATARARSSVAVLAAARSRTATLVARLSRALARASKRTSALVAKLPLPRIPVPALSIRTLRIVSVGITMSFVFATAIGTTGLVATQGTIALGASTTLTIISGEVTVQDPGASGFVAAVDGQVLQAGMTIRTGADSYAVLTYFEGSTVSIDPDTVLVIEALVANPDGSTIIGMRQDVGRTWHAVTKLLTAGSKYEVRTPNATATVRGTQFIVGVEEDSQGVPFTLIETAEGAVAAERPPTAQAPQGEEVIVPAGFQVQAKPQEAIPPPVPAPEPERKVTVEVGASNALVLDPQGRANGTTKDGKVIVQTPGARVSTTPDGRVVVTMPNVSDGKVSTVVQPATAPTSPGVPPQPPAPVQIVTTVSEKGKGDVKSEETVQAPVNAPAVTGVDVKKSEGTAPTELRKLDDAEKQQAPAPKVAEAPKPEPEKQEERKAEEETKGEDATPSPKAVVARILSVTLPPLSKEELAKREEDRRKAEERAKEEAERRERERQAAEEKRIAELRRNEDRAKEELRRVGQEREQAERRSSEETSRRETESRGGQGASQTGGQSGGVQQGAGQTEAQGRQQEQPAPANVFQQLLKVITPAEPPREDERKAEELRRAEQRAKEEAEKLEDERKRAEAREREKQIAKQEEARRESERRAEDLRRAEQRAKEEADRKVEELRRLEEKAREQARHLEAEQRREAERRLQEFRDNEERTRREEGRRLEEQRRAEERARQQAEERLRELRRQEEQAREEERRREHERDEERQRERERNRFVPNETLRPLPGRTRSIDEEAAQDTGSKKSEIESAVREVVSRLEAVKQELRQKADERK